MRIEGLWTPVPTMVMNEAVKIQNRDTKAQNDSLPHSREYEICPSVSVRVISGKSRLTMILKTATINPHQTPQIELEERERRASSPANT
jgi:hypothetical protein